MHPSRKIKIVEVGPRDGLQNEKKTVSLEAKVELVNLLSKTGLEFIETGSFVSPKWVPQMAGSDTLFQLIERREKITYTALTPNLEGYKAARMARADEVAIFIAASETFSRKNTNCTIAESLARAGLVLGAAKRDNIPVRGYISCISHCPFEGRIDPVVVANLAAKLVDMGCHEISLGDTIGKAGPKDIANILEAVLENVPAELIAGHFHDTDNNAIANIEQALALGITTFDASIAGLGGCPYAPGAPGNLATEKLVQFLEQKGFATGIDGKVLAHAKAFVKNVFHSNSARPD